MELRHVDPKTLLDNPNNPRRAQTDDAEDRRLAYSIKAAGLIHPPVVRELEDGVLMIVAGHRRTRAAIRAGLKSIAVHVRDGDEKTDDLAALSENLVRLNMSDVDQWKAVTRLRTERRMTDRAICQALMFTPAKLKQLELLSNLHPPMLDAIQRRLLPTPQQLATIAAAPLDDQAFVWGQQFVDEDEEYDADDDGYDEDDEEGIADDTTPGDDASQDIEPEAPVSSEGPETSEDDPRDRLWPDEPGSVPDWVGMANALRRTRFFARDARFDDAQAKAVGVIWTEDLFAEGGADNRFTEDRNAYEAAQRGWLDAAVGDGFDVFGVDPYGNADLPDHCVNVGRWMEPKESDRTGYYLDPRSLVVKEFRFRERAPVTAGTLVGTGTLAVAAAAPPKERPDISRAGHGLIGARRTQALHAALNEARPDADPWTLVAALLFAFAGENVSVQGDSGAYYPRPALETRKEVARRIAPDGFAVADVDVLRNAAIDVVAKVASCASEGQEKSGDPALLLGVLFEANRHLPSFSDDDFLKTFSKGGITKALRGEGIAPRNTGKEMRSALVSHLAGARWVPEAARFESVLPGWREQVTRAAVHAASVADEGEDDCPFETGDEDTAPPDDDDREEGPGVASEDEPPEEETLEVASGAADEAGLQPNDPERFLREHLEIVVVR
ncbi:hypothetical protein A0U89_15190 (plasmid) [Kozakia baliensis]|uniref:ParB-like N-terminal domain-containing protein n=3 Tax=Kozakia baliensis TaxID=153496 RepID=A0A1D8UYA9_9PROT|nr:ParB/RepB/Spo0J family partition protein [Kozakia baliensis]AOX18653.1 hypothetical protein A0U89_15190 [Kozakia baliensis]GEL65494.1 hypothetical protein KBA01_27800 [Kozakia baliensis]